MADQLYGQRGLSSVYSTTSRSAIDSYLSEPSLLGSSRYIPSYSDHHSLSSDRSPSALFSDRTPSLLGDSLRPSSGDIIGGGLSAVSRSIAASTALWTSFDVSSRSIAASATSSGLWSSFDGSSGLSKRPSEAIYGQSVLGAHMIGQNEAWLTSDTLTKRPRLESTSDLPIYPQRPGEKDCAHYMLTRTCKFGDNCKFDHPIWVPLGGIPDWKEPPSIPSDSHPERPGEPDCPYFLKTQKCKFGLNCKFNHPSDILGTSGKNAASDLPERPSEPPCSFYMKTGNCRFGSACKFHHPKGINVPSARQEAGKGEQTISVEISGASTTLVPTVSPALSYNSKGLPKRSGETDCPFYMKTGSCKYGANCRYNHPDRNVIDPPAAAIGHAVLSSPVPALNTGLVNPSASILYNLHPTPAQAMFGLGPSIYPQRPGEIECDYYMKNGECKFGENCKFHHPVDRFEKTRRLTQEQNVKLTLAGLPRREGVLHCPFYMKTGTCGYGATCKFDHPPPGEVMASAVAGKETSASGVEDDKKGGQKLTAQERKESSKEG